MCKVSLDMWSYTYKNGSGHIDKSGHTQNVMIHSMFDYTQNVMKVETRSRLLFLSKSGISLVQEKKKKC